MVELWSINKFFLFYRFPMTFLYSLNSIDRKMNKMSFWIKIKILNI
jgi:hypothetical protein